MPEVLAPLCSACKAQDTIVFLALPDRRIYSPQLKWLMRGISSIDVWVNSAESRVSEAETESYADYWRKARGRVYMNGHLTLPIGNKMPRQKKALPEQIPNPIRPR